MGRERKKRENKRTERTGRVGEERRKRENKRTERTGNREREFKLEISYLNSFLRNYLTRVLQRMLAPQ